MIDSPHRIVIDTGVILSRGILPVSIPARAFETALRTGIVLASDETLTELKTVLLRSKFNSYLALEERLQFFKKFIETVEHITVQEQVLECRDVRDNKFLEAAINGRARTIITGDTDLLILHPWRNISILTPAQYLATLT